MELFALATLVIAASMPILSGPVAAQTADAGSGYKLINTAKVGGAGGFDYVYADSAGRRLYIPRGDRVTVFDLDTLKSAGEIPNTKGVHGAAVDPKSHHGFSSSTPVVMWDTQTLATIKTIDVQGRPDGILFDPATSHILILSHATPNVTVINAEDGAIVGTVDIGGAPEQAASNGEGKIYIDVEDKDNVAVLDAKTLKVTAHYDIAGKGGGLAGLALDAKNHVLFACCHNPAVCVVLNADDGKVLATLPIGNGVDATTFNPQTMEAFVSTGDGVLTVIKENSPTDFAVEQSVKTKSGAKTHTLDTKTNQLYLITADRAAPTSQPSAQAGDTSRPAGRGGRGGRGQMVPDSFSILVVGK